MVGLGSAVDDESGMFMADKTLEFEHGFPPTKLMFCPESGLKIFKKDLLITSSDILRLWEVTEDGTKKVVELQNVRSTLQLPPLPSLKAAFCVRLAPRDVNVSLRCSSRFRVVPFSLPNKVGEQIRTNSNSSTNTNVRIYTRIQKRRRTGAGKPAYAEQERLRRAADVL